MSTDNNITLSCSGKISVAGHTIAISQASRREPVTLDIDGIRVKVRTLSQAFDFVNSLYRG